MIYLSIITIIEAITIFILVKFILKNFTIAINELEIKENNDNRS